MIIIPARVASSRLPNKVLALIGDIPMVIRTAQVAQKVDSVIIATDSQEVIDVANSYNIKAILTSNSHKSGTDRVFEAATKIGLKDNDIILNIQADEPFIEEDVIKSLYDLTVKYKNESSVVMASCYKNITSSEANDPNIVKVVTTITNLALYFSRAKIPYSRDNTETIYKAHLGLYGFTYSKLKKFCSFSVGEIEDIEKLEQLRVLDNNLQIALTKVNTVSFGIDTKEDLIKANKFLGYIFDKL